MNKSLREKLLKFKNKKILVVGDIILDQYSFGVVSRISPEAPIPILQKTEEKFIPGGAANVANNIVDLGATVSLCGVIGNDIEGKILLKILRDKKINIGCIIKDKLRPTTVKHRFIQGFHQLLRTDEEFTDNIDLASEKKLISLIKNNIENVDCIVFSDYAKGLFSKNLTKAIIALAKKYKKLTLADIKPRNKLFYKNVDFITPNLKEGQEMSGKTDAVEVIKKLARYFHSNIILTKGVDGIDIFDQNENKYEQISTKHIKVFDVSGAGDTVVAVIALSLVSGISLKDAAKLANIAGGIVVQKIGTATITFEELQSELQEINHVEGLAIVPKVWGYEKWLENNEKYCSKLLYINKGYQCSLHYHKKKDEMFIILKGNVRMEIDKKIMHMREGHFQRILPGTRHRFRGIEDSIIIEVSTHHEEEDSYRLEKSRKV